MKRILLAPHVQMVARSGSSTDLITQTGTSMAAAYVSAKIVEHMASNGAGNSIVYDTVNVDKILKNGLP